MAKDPKKKQLQFLKEILGVNEDINLFFLVGESVATLLRGSVSVASLLRGCVKMKLTLSKLGLGSPLGLSKL